MPRGIRKPLFEAGTPGPDTIRTTVEDRRRADEQPGRGALRCLEAYRADLGRLEVKALEMSGAAPVIAMKIRIETILSAIREAQRHADRGISDTLAILSKQEQADLAATDQQEKE